VSPKKKKKRKKEKGRDQEDCGCQANSSRDPISENLITKKDWWRGSRCTPRVQTLVLKKKQKGIPSSYILEYLKKNG
jgi:hypothetical protein